MTTHAQHETHTFGPAIARKRLAEDGVIEIRIPRDADYAKLDTPEGEVKYFRFKQGMKGGSMSCYLHTGDQSLSGRMVRVSFTLFERTHLDKSKHVHLDFRPTDRAVTHRLFFLGQDELPLCESDWPRFQTPQNRRGFVVIAPHDATLKQPEVAPPVPSGSDPQLERLLKAGWAIKEDHGATVVLGKMNGVGEKTMTHHRRKKK